MKNNVESGNPEIVLTLAAPSTPIEFLVELRWIEKKTDTELAETVIATGKMKTVRE